ncbi:hypothetical protein PoB_000120000 [Plakobranchus ocellatus]|uniref:Uncharacterized protein n=1 Tax=Plakobranchus ocellatus TaxID=259542 RepID=A0AAV3XWA6_9GAST|nr:hypothetical protein PoB_000120000 [Plakobranchus ocellatus]
MEPAPLVTCQLERRSDCRRDHTWVTTTGDKDWSVVRVGKEGRSGEGVSHKYFTRNHTTTLQNVRKKSTSTNQTIDYNSYAKRHNRSGSTFP